MVQLIAAHVSAMIKKGINYNMQVDAACLAAGKKWKW